MLLLAGCASASPLRDFAFGLLAESRDDAAAASHFETALEADPLAFPLVDRLARARMREGDRAGAVKLLRDLAEAKPGDMPVQFAYADFLREHGAGDALATKLEEEVLERALAENPGNPEVVRRLFRLWFSTGRKERATAVLDQLSEEDPAAVMLRANLSRSVFEAENQKESERTDRALLQATRANPEDARLARRASEHFREAGRLETAIEILAAHTEAAPSSIDLRARLGILHLAADEHEKGEGILKEVLEIHPRHALAHQSLAKLYKSLDRADLARHHSGELLKIRGGSATEFMELADEATAAGEIREARLLLEKAAFDHPENLPLKMKLAMATRRDPETAAQAGRLFLEVEAALPDGMKPEPEFLVEAAEALIGEGDSAAGEERLREAIRGFPADAKVQTASALRRLASLWEEEDRNLNAARSLRQRAESLDPD